MDGQPDLQGVWDYRSVTPLQRPAEFADKATLTDAEIAAYEKTRGAALDKDRRDGGAAADVARAYNDFWWDYGKKVVGAQTSLIVDPPDGKVPPLTADGQKRADARRVFQTTNAREEGGAGAASTRGSTVRSVSAASLWGVAGPPMAPGPYNNNVQLIQSKDWVVIVNEMIHEHRMVPLDGRPHADANIRLWQGDSRGHWDGDTLVVETTNFNDKRNFQGSSENMRLIERFTRVAPDTLVYEYTVDDPATFTKPWTARLPMAKNPDPIYEYACHEGNYAMPHGLEGRAQHREGRRERLRRRVRSRFRSGTPPLIQSTADPEEIGVGCCCLRSVPIARATGHITSSRNHEAKARICKTQNEISDVNQYSSGEKGEGGGGSIGLAVSRLAAGAHPSSLRGFHGDAHAFVRL